MNSQCRFANEDPLGFTRQTATMLVGLGAKDLVPQFKKRNISSQALTALSKQDLMVLGADESLADDMLRELRAAARKTGGRDLSEELRTKQLIKILACANNQLDLIQTFISYARLRLAKDPEDFVIDVTTNVRASQALIAAAECTIDDVDRLEKNFAQLAAEFSDRNFHEKNLKLLFVRFLTGMGFFVGLGCALRYGIVSIGRT